MRSRLSPRNGRPRRRISLEPLESRLLLDANPFLTVDGGQFTYWEDGDNPHFIAPNATVSYDGSALDGSVLEIQGLEGANRWDALTLLSQGNGPGEVGITGDAVTYSGNEVGTLYVRPPIVGAAQVYKVVDGQELNAYILNPPTSYGPDNRPAVVLFHGGGWTNGAPGQLTQDALYLASRGMVTIAVEYRLVDINSGDAPIPCIEDAKSAIRWVRTHALELGIDPNRIAAMGRSSGGHLSAATAMINGVDDPADDLSISSKPNAQILFEPVIDNSPGHWGSNRVGSLYPQLSPAFNVSSDDPPAVVFVGQLDPINPPDVVDHLVRDMAAAGVRLDLHSYPNQFHNFAAYVWDNPYYYDTMRKVDEFLISLGWLSGTPTIQQPQSPPADDWVSMSTVTFNSQATLEAVQAVMRDFVLLVSDDPGDAVRTIAWQWTDGAGRSSNEPVSHIGIVPQNDPPVVTLSGTAYYKEGAAPYLITPYAFVSDPDSAYLSGATLTVDHLDYYGPEDRLEFQPTGTGPRQVSFSGNTVLYEGSPAGTWSGGAGATPLVVRFNDNTTLLMIKQVMCCVTFRAVGVNPTVQTRMIRYVVNDGNERGDSEPVFKRVIVQPVNSAPVITDSTARAAGNILQGAASPSGIYVRNLVAGRVSDVDGNGAGVAITSLGRFDAGVWQYSRNAGSSWSTISVAPSSSSALLLPGDDVTMIRFIPGAAFTGQVGIYFRAWDRTQGNVGGRWNPIGRSGNYSAFSEQVGNSVLNVVPRSANPAVILGGTLNYNVPSPPMVLAAGATVSDRDSVNFAGGSLIVRIAANATANDLLTIRNQGTGTGQIGISSNRVTYGGVTMGTFSGGVGAAPLTVVFTANATPQAAQALVRQIMFSTSGSPPALTQRTVVFVVRDGRGGTSSQTTATKYVTVSANNINPSLVLGGSIKYKHDSAAIFLASGALVSDPDSADFAGGEFRVHVATGASSSYRLGIAGGFQIDASNNVLYNSQIVGVLNPNGGTGTTDLIVTLKPAATAQIVQRLVRAVHFRTVRGTAGSCTVEFSVHDGDGGTSAKQIKTVEIS